MVIDKHVRQACTADPDPQVSVTACGGHRQFLQSSCFSPASAPAPLTLSLTALTKQCILCRPMEIYMKRLSCSAASHSVRSQAGRGSRVFDCVREPNTDLQKLLLDYHSSNNR
ncbi:hypothetical protein JOB18_020277 [Solea senegalensis]|uniref:Uncharacterized protein n=1 Tax=Solea senegalensis TaxID=28829 RepID=A0AAV6SDH3_SOLSE|nr:hypothetical protein JOB18_020277 [Solea senegalensis]